MLKYEMLSIWRGMLLRALVIFNLLTCVLLTGILYIQASVGLVAINAFSFAARSFNLYSIFFSLILFFSVAFYSTADVTNRAAMVHISLGVSRMRIALAKSAISVFIVFVGIGVFLVPTMLLGYLLFGGEEIVLESTRITLFESSVRIVLVGISVAAILVPIIQLTGAIGVVSKNGLVAGSAGVMCFFAITAVKKQTVFFDKVFSVPQAFVEATSLRDSLTTENVIIFIGFVVIGTLVATIANIVAWSRVEFR